MSEEITRMPAVALRGMTILPSMIVHFDVSRDKSIKAIEQAMTADQKLFVVTQRDPEASDPGIDDLYHIGTVVEIKQLVKLPKNIIRVLVEGLERAELLVKNLRQVGNTFFINCFRHKLEISKNSQNNSRKKKKKDRCPEPFFHDTFFSVCIMVFSFHSSHLKVR